MVGEITITELAKKIDDQARFTRSVCIVCTMTILGVMFYTMTEMFNNLPSMTVLHFMGRLSQIEREWKAIELSESRAQAAPAK